MKSPPKALDQLSPRGERTRAKLVAAARVVFERDGFATARITDIAELASAAVGSFYTYFDTKEMIFRAVIEMVDSEFTQPLPREVGSDPLARIQAGNRIYVRNYARNARILAAMQHRSFEDPELNELRQRSRRRWIDRAERTIRRVQDERRIATDVAPRFVATALSGMVHAFCYESFAFGRKGEFDEEEIAAGLSLIWFRAIGIGNEISQAVTPPPPVKATGRRRRAP